MRGSSCLSKSKITLTEHDEQCMVMDWWAKAYPKYYGCLFSIPNASHLAGNQKQRFAKAAKLKAEGLRPGAADLFLAVARGDYHGFFIEMKRTGATKCRVKQNQFEFIHDMREQNYKADWYPGYSAAIKAIEKYMEL